MLKRKPMLKPHKIVREISIYVYKGSTCSLLFKCSLRTKVTGALCLYFPFKTYLNLDLSVLSL